MHSHDLEEKEVSYEMEDHSHEDDTDHCIDQEQVTLTIKTKELRDASSPVSAPISFDHSPLLEEFSSNPPPQKIFRNQKGFPYLHSVQLLS